MHQVESSSHTGLVKFPFPEIETKRKLGLRNPPVGKPGEAPDDGQHTLSNLLVQVMAREACACPQLSRPSTPDEADCQQSHTPKWDLAKHPQTSTLARPTC